MAGSFYGNGFYGNNNPYFNPQQQMNNLINQHPQFFNQAFQNAVQTQQQPQQQNISTQPPIMQPQNENRNSAKMFYVGNREEATATPVDLVYSTPTFFYNRGSNEVYMKQYDATTGNALFKVYIEQIQPKIAQMEQKTGSATIAIPNDNAYMNELKMIRAGIEGLYRYFNQPKYPYSVPQKSNNKDEVIDVDFVEQEIEDEPIKEKKGSKK